MTHPRTRTGSTELAFHASRIIIDAGVLIVMAAMSMPFVTSEAGNTDSLAADALPVVLLLAPIFLITLIPNHTKPIPMVLGWASLVLGIAAFPYAIVKYLDAGNLAATIDGSVGFGPRLLIFGTFVTLSGIGVGLARNMLHLPSRGTYPDHRGAPGPQNPTESRRRQSQFSSGATPRQAPQPRTQPRPVTTDQRREGQPPRPQPSSPTQRRARRPDDR